MSSDRVRVWCPNCMRLLYLPQTNSGEFHKTACEHCRVQFLYDRYGQVKRISKE
jgi:hypothetical protein